MTYSVRGVVLDEQGRPLEGAEVFADEASTRSAADGSFTLVGSSIAARAGDLFAPDVSIGTEELVTLRMRRGVTFIARVFADGAPLGGATVALRGSRAVTDDLGVATLRGLPARYLDHQPELEYRGRVVAPGRASHRLRISVPPGTDVIDQTIELEPGAPVQGRVVDYQGKPIRANVIVYDGARELDDMVTKPDGQDAVLDLVVLERGRIVGTTELETPHRAVVARQPDEPEVSHMAMIYQGRFEFALPPGDYDLAVDPKTVLQRVTVVSGQTIEVTLAQ